MSILEELDREIELLRLAIQISLIQCLLLFFVVVPVDILTNYRIRKFRTHFKKRGRYDRRILEISIPLSVLFNVVTGSGVAKFLVFAGLFSTTLSLALHSWIFWTWWTRRRRRRKRLVSD
jgi:hypothetical protein